MCDIVARACQSLPPRAILTPYGREFLAGVTPGYLWLRDMAGPCDAVRASALDVSSPVFAQQACEHMPACEFFVYSDATHTAQLCRGLLLGSATPASGLVYGIKPTALAIQDMAVLTNQHALCPASRLVAESDVDSLDVATAFCVGNADCSHFSFNLGSRPASPFKQLRARFCSGDLAAMAQEGAVVVVKAT
uniref:Uncharacterized protein n=1 Tax=Alexandrium monilatum TaxID=311494 RepID=A0A6T1K541_9DINO